MSNCRCVALAVALLLTAFGQAKAGVINAASASLLNVTAAVGLAVDGDTVVIPAGNVSWTGQLRITKNITLQGAGVNSTVINTAYNEGITTASKGCVQIAVTKDLPFGLNGFTLNTSGGTPALWVIGGTSGTINPSNAGTSMRFRMTDVKLSSTVSLTTHFEDVCGVIDHCTLTGGDQFAQIFHERWKGGSNAHGSFSNPVNWGSSEFLFFEDCNITNTDTANTHGSDAYAGARYVVRHCTLNRASVTDHGTETHMARGTRAIECYNNTFSGGSGSLAEHRSGTLVTHDNILGGNSSGWRLQNHRNFFIKDLGAVTGVNQFDQNTALDGDGNPTSGNITPNADSGTVSSPIASAGQITLTDNSKNWAGTGPAGGSLWDTLDDANPSNNAGFIYQVVNTSRTGTATVAPGYIVSNTATTLSITAGVGGNNAPGLQFSAGEHYAIRKIYAAIDQPGMGMSDTMNGYQPSPAFWPHQQRDPCYSWNNWTAGTFSGDTLAGSGTQLNLWTAQGMLKEGRDFFNRTVKPGYTPYTYPHPLTGLALTGPAPPANLRVVAQP